MSEKILPVTVVVSNLYKDYFSPFSDYQKHVESLDIDAFGDVLIIRAGDWLEEVALIEPAIVTKAVTSLTLIGSNDALAWPIEKVFKQNYELPLQISGTSYEELFDSQPDLSFDTIMFIGTPMTDPEDSLPYLAKQLKRGGHLYATINSFRTPNPPPDIENCTVKIIPNIPTHPLYNDVAGYYGVVVEKQK